MKKLIAILLLIAALTLCFVACGDDADANETDIQTTDTTDDTTETTDDGDEDVVPGTLVTGEYTPYY